MKALIQKWICQIKQAVSLVSRPSVRNAKDPVISGYSDSRYGEQQHLLSDHLDHGLIGILSAEIVDCSRFREQNEELIHIQIAESMKIMEMHVTVNCGKILHLASDAIIAEFNDAECAMECAINVQLAARQWNAGFCPYKQVRFRFGISFGDFITDQIDTCGNAVNRYASFENCAFRGDESVSNPVRSRLMNQSSFKFVVLNKKYITNINKPTHVFWIVTDSHPGVGVDQKDDLKIAAMTI